MIGPERGGGGEKACVGVKGGGGVQFQDAVATEGKKENNSGKPLGPFDYN